jgi:hypothetical protein
VTYGLDCINLLPIDVLVQYVYATAILSTKTASVALGLNLYLPFLIILKILSHMIAVIFFQWRVIPIRFGYLLDNLYVTLRSAKLDRNLFPFF